MADYKHKSGGATYTVIADTHGYITGSLDADFDLGDNTNSNPMMLEPIQPTRATKMTLLGNHDVAQLMHESGLSVEKNDLEPVDMPDDKQWRGLQEYTDDEHKILVLGPDSAKTFHYYIIPHNEILQIAQRLTELEEDWDVMILTHPPLFPPRTNTGAAWPLGSKKRWDRFDESLRNAPDESYTNYMKSPRLLMRILGAFQTKTAVTIDGVTFDYSDKTTNNVIGCFCGHIHNSIKCAVSLSDFWGECETTPAARKKIYMEAFPTNGSAEYPTENQANAGMYTPDRCKIEIDFDKKTVNGESYVAPAICADYIIGTVNHGRPFTEHITGDKKLSADAEFYPKFYENRCIGWGVTPHGKGMRYGNNIHDIDGVFVEGLDKNVDKIRFSASGLLKYYIETGTTVQKTIPDFDKITLSFTATSGVRWTFKGGYLVSAEDIK